MSLAKYAQLRSRRSAAPLVLLTALFATSSGCAQESTGTAGLDAETAAALEAALTGEHRSEQNSARDAFRKPREVLEFLGFRSDMTVVEIWPGGGWYTEVLAPALRGDGTLYAAQYSPNPRYAYQRRYFGSFLTKMGQSPDAFSEVKITTLKFPDNLDVAPAGSADLVVTFRNAHNWVDPGYGDGAAELGFKVMYDALKPGGVLGIVDHRWPDSSNEDPSAANGYISEERIVAMAESAGFRLEASSDLLRNDKDTHDHPEGVWTLPPSLALGEQDRDKYLAIGESDRMLLKFVKPGD